MKATTKILCLVLISLLVFSATAQPPMGFGRFGGGYGGQFAPRHFPYPYPFPRPYPHYPPYYGYPWWYFRRFPWIYYAEDQQQGQELLGSQ